jgi:hypothetical protein
MQCWNTAGVFRLIQSIPSPNAEPFKRWLARVGKERLDEIENPELAVSRMQQLYEQKGYPKEWIEKRLRGSHLVKDTCATGYVHARRGATNCVFPVEGHGDFVGNKQL